MVVGVSVRSRQIGIGGGCGAQGSSGTMLLKDPVSPVQVVVVSRRMIECGRAAGPRRIVCVQIFWGTRQQRCWLKVGSLVLVLSWLAWLDPACHGASCSARVRIVGVLCW